MSIQSAMNQMIGSVGNTAYQLTIPKRLAEAQAKKAEEMQKEQWEKLSKAEQAAQMKAESLQSAVDVIGEYNMTDEESLKTYEDLAEARKAQAKVKEAMFEQDPSAETLNAMEEYQLYARDAANYAKEMRKKAESTSMDSLSSKVDTQAAQKSALDERLKFLNELNQEGYMSNTQKKKYEYKLKQGGNA